MPQGWRLVLGFGSAGVELSVGGVGIRRGWGLSYTAGMETRPLTFLGMTLRNLYRQRLRTSLTILGVSVGVVAMVAFTAVVRGMWAATQGSITAGGTDLLVFQKGVAGDIFSSLDEKKTEASLRAVPGVADVGAALTHVMPVGGKPFFITFGVRPDDYSSKSTTLISGRTIKADDEVALGKLAASALDKKVGDTLTIWGREYKVVGIFETEVVFYNGALVMNLTALQKLTKRPGLVTTFQIKVAPGEKPVEVSWRIEKANPDVVAIASAAQYNKVDNGLDMIAKLQVAVSVLSMIVGGLIVLNTMWMSVHERTKEIGVLRAVGWSRRRVIGMILLESLGVGVMACVIGTPLGFGLANATTLWSTTSRFIQPVFDAEPVLVSMVVGVLLSILGGFAPAWRASRISPVEALRYE